MRRLSLAASLLLFLTAPAAAFDAKDRTFQPGRVGAIVAGKTKPADLARIYGAGNVRKATMDEPGGGETHPGAFVFQETPQPTREDDAAMEQLTKPEAKVSSSHPAVKTAGLAVSFISVSFRPK